MTAITPKQYSIQMLVAVVAYIGSIYLINVLYDAESLSRFVLPVLPIACVLYVGVLFLKFVWGMDELWRKIISEAGAFAGLATGMICLSYTFFEEAGAPRFQAWWAWMILNTLYLCALAILRKRY